MPAMKLFSQSWKSSLNKIFIMKKALFSFIYFKLLGWKADIQVPDFDKCIICAAPHTSNWDLFIGKLFYGAVGRDAGFLMKKEWFFFPLGYFFRWMGGIPVFRVKHTYMLDAIVDISNYILSF